MNASDEIGKPLAFHRIVAFPGLHKISNSIINIEFIENTYYKAPLIFKDNQCQNSLSEIGICYKLICSLH